MSPFEQNFDLALKAAEDGSSLEVKTELKRALLHLESDEKAEATKVLDGLLASIDRSSDVWVHREWSDDIEAQAKAIELFRLSDEDFENRLKSEMSSALQRASYASEPFPHFSIADVFSLSTYIGLLLSAPHITLMRPIASPKYLKDGHFQRYQTAITPKVFEPAHKRVRRAWLAMDKIMRDDDICRLMCEKLGVERPKSWKVHTRLQLDRAGACIQPHKDGENGALLTFQMYFPLNKSNFTTGTELFKLEGKKFETVKQMPFKSNFAYAFRIGDDSWHGSREPIAKLSEGRLSFLVRVRAED